MNEYLFKHFKDMRHDGFLNNISITLIDKIDGKNPKKRKNYWRRTGGEHWKPTRLLNVTLKTFSDQEY